MARQQSLMSFLKPLNKKQKEGIPVADLAATSDAGCSKLVERQSMTAEIHNRSNDIGTYIGKAVEDSTKILLLESPWTPSQNYNFPFSTRKVAGKEIKHYVSIKHLDAYKDWLVLSDFAKGLFCKYCALFTIRNEGGFRKNVLLRALVTEPLKNFKHLTGENGDLEAHSRHLYHKDAITSGKDFVRTYHNPNSEIRSLVDKNTKSLIKTNREILLPIVKTIILLGRQNIPLRGHRDDGPIRNGVVTKNEGNFRAMIRYRVDAGDKILENHLQSSSSRATYVSKTTQDKLIDCCRVEILNKILKKVYDSSFYSVIFDETPDLSGKAQVSFVLRYVDYLSDGPIIKEDFVTFIDAFGELSSCDQDIEDNERDTANEEISLTGVSIGQLVLKKMKEMKLKLENCVGIGTDGCAVMLAENGAVKEVQSEAINALMTPCFSHKLNNSISKSLKISLIEKTSSYIREVTRFFKSSRPKRNTVLAQFLGKKLVQLCETRWVERHDSVLQFISSLPEIVEALTRISMWKNKETAGKALVLIAALCSSEFVVGIFCLGDILSLTHPLSVILQKEAIDLAKASDVVSTLIATLLTRRQEADEYFDQLFNDAIQMANKLDIEIKKPRTCGRQKHRENYAIDDTKIFYRVSVYIPLLDNIIEDLKTRFSPAVMDVFKLTALLPENTLNLDSGQLKQISEDAIGRFGNLLEQKRDIQILRLKGELCHWQQKWRDQILSGIGELPRSAFETLQCCDSDIYPTIQKLLQIFCTLPVTNSSAERSFSSLRCIKTWLRTTMLENRLIGLALLHIHYDIVLNPEDVIERFSKMGNHRILL